ncbi:hypothetical protein ACJ41O_010321 [Fusarium nematophilum]
MTMTPNPAQPEQPEDACQITPQPLNEDQQELSRILKDVKHDPTLMGVVSLGRDGIFRSLTADRQVVDAIPLPPRLIKALLDRMPFDPQNEIDFRGVDGRNTPQEQWYNPDKDLLPRPYVVPEEKRKEVEARIEEAKKLMEERKNKPKCPVRIMSDHDLGLREGGSGSGASGPMA